MSFTVIAMPADNMNIHPPFLQNFATLVCKNWLYSSRFHLFSRVRLFSFNIDIALDILPAPQSTIPSYICWLEINNYAGLFANDAFVSLPPLSALVRLTLRDIPWNSLSASAKGNLHSLSRNLTTLQLHCIYFESFSQQLELIASAPLLETLFLGTVVCDKDLDDPSTQLRAPRLRRLAIGGSASTPSLLRWLLSASQSVSSIHTLSLTIGLHLHDVKPLSTYIRAFGPSLENLAISVYSGLLEGNNNVIIQNMLSDELDLRKNTSLRTISFPGISLLRNSGCSKSSNWVRSILSKVSSRAIERVSFSLKMKTPDELVPFDLPALGELFTGGNPCLSSGSTKIQFEVRGDVNRDEAHALISQALRRLDTQGKLEFGVIPGPFSS
ncbi:hypothetical protein BDZ97DRAFT_2076541 [Flammula alnicola]|nr:hypothetical protein BDZ97DRAFT_2076541 [Flammula alnicola]